MKLRERLTWDRFWSWAMDTKIGKQVVIFAVGNVLILVVVYATIFQQPVNLNLSPAEPQVQILTPDQAYYLTLAIMPLLVFFEEMGMRKLPDLIWTLGKTKKGTVKKLLGSKYIPFFIISSMIFHALLHQSNVVSADLMGRVLYFAVQSWGGFFLARTYILYGLKASWVVHYAWNTIAMLILPIFL